MKTRYLYLLIFAIPGFFISIIISFVIFGALAGFLWLFIFGDTPWPSSLEKTLPILLFITFLLIWSAIMTTGFISGKKLETQKFNKNHLLISAALTIVPILLIVFHQLRVGNIGPKPESTLCTDYCNQKGYLASSLSPQISGGKICGCFDESGLEVLKISLAEITSKPARSQDND